MPRLYATNEVLQAAAVAVGNGTVLNVAGLARLGLHVTIADTATVRFEGSIDGQGWGPVTMTDAGGNSADHATASGVYQGDVSGLSLFKARISDWTAGAVTVTALGTTAKGN